MSDCIALTITALSLLDKRIADIVKGGKVASALLISVVGRVHFEAVCQKSGVVHPSPHLNPLKFYQKIAKVLASCKRALIHV